MGRPDFDCVFVHAPKADNHYLPFGDFFNITYMPMGVLAIAEMMRRNQLRTEVIHLGVEWLCNPEFNIVESLDGAQITAIGLPLYWHYQSFDTIEVARALKASHPEAFIFLGGITAGYFAEELVRDWDCIDGVLKGHAEGSAVALVSALKAGSDLRHVPNLVHKQAGEVVINSPAAGGSAVPHPPLDSLVYSDLSVMRHPEVYAKSFGFPLAYGREYTSLENRNMLSMGRAFFPLFVGRGCPWMCTFCGGNRDTLKRVNGTNKLQWRSHDAIMADIYRARDYGYKTMALCFDPTPSRDDFYVELMERIEREKVGIDFYFECWGLPTKRFIQTFRRAFPSPESYLAVSPDSGNEQVRKINKQPYYDNNALFTALQQMDEVDLSFDVFYTMALPGEQLHTASDTADQMNHIAATHSNARRIMVWTVQLEPGSAQFERPEQFNMVTDRNCFADYYRVHGGDRADTYSSLGFKINNYFGDVRDNGSIADFETHLQHLKCMNFCFLGRDPRFWNTPAKGRQHCFERRSMLAKKRGIPAPKKPIGADYNYMQALADENASRGPRERFSWL